MALKDIMQFPSAVGKVFFVALLVTEPEHRHFFAFQLPRRAELRNLVVVRCGRSPNKCKKKVVPWLEWGGWTTRIINFGWIRFSKIARALPHEWCSPISFPFLPSAPLHQLTTLLGNYSLTHLHPSSLRCASDPHLCCRLVSPPPRHRILQKWSQDCPLHLYDFGR